MKRLMGAKRGIIGQQREIVASARMIKGCEDTESERLIRGYYGKMRTVKRRQASEAALEFRREYGPRLQSMLNEDLIKAAEAGDKSKAERLIGFGAEINAIAGKRSETALIAAIRTYHPETAEMLIEKGADVNAACSYGMTALMMAAKKGPPWLVERLIAESAEVETKATGGYTPLMGAIEGDRPSSWEVSRPIRIGYSENEKTAIVAMLIKNGADVNAPFANFEFPIINMAAQYGNAVIMRMLIEKGADVDSIDRYGNTALIMAIVGKKTRMAEMLIDSGADIHAKDAYGFTALTLTSARGDFDLVRKLVQSGADVNAKDDRGERPWNRLS